MSAKRLGDVVFMVKGKQFLTTNTYYTPETEDGVYDELKALNPITKAWETVPWCLEDWIMTDLGGTDAILEASRKAYSEVVDD